MGRTEGGATTVFHIDPSNPTGYAQVLEEGTDANGDGTLGAGEAGRAFTLGASVLAQATRRAAAVGVLNLLADARGGTRATLDAATGAVTAGFAYTAGGAPVGFTLAGAPTPILYAGQYLDALTGLSYNRRRWYDPATGVFTRMDDRRARPVDWRNGNYLSYAANDQINRSDPSGLFSITESLVTSGISTIVWHIVSPVIKPIQELLSTSLFNSIVPTPIIAALNGGGWSTDALVFGGAVGGSVGVGPFGGAFNIGLDIVVPLRRLATPSVYLFSEYNVGFGRTKTGFNYFYKGGFAINTADSTAYDGGYRAVTFPITLLPKAGRATLDTLLPKLNGVDVLGPTALGPFSSIGNPILSKLTGLASKFSPDIEVSIAWSTSGESWSISIVKGGRTSGSTGTFAYSVGYSDLKTVVGVPFR